MKLQITCPSCQTKLTVGADLKPNSKVKCPKCGQLIAIPAPKPVLTPDSQPALAVEERPPLSRSISPVSIFAYALPTGAILLALLSVALPTLFGQNFLGLV